MTRIISAPIVVDLCITNRCNLRCKHCFAFSDTREAGAEPELTLEQLQFIIDRLNQAQVFTVIITGGEPLLRPDFFKIVTYIKRYPIMLGLNTNATLVTDEVSKEIAGLGFRARISVSLDGANKQTYGLLRGAGAFEQAIRGLENLLKYNKNIRLFCVVTQYNFRELENIVKLAKSLGAPCIEFNCLLRGERAICYPQLFLTPEQKLESFEKIIQLKEVYGNYIGGSFLRQAGKAKKLLAIPDVELLKLKAGFLQRCDAGFKKAAITSTGKLTPCYAMPDYTVGDLFKQSLKEIWKDSPLLEEFRKMHDVSLDQVESSRDCIYKGLCNGGCRAGAYYHSQKAKLNTCDPEGCLLSLRGLKS